MLRVHFIRPRRTPKRFNLLKFKVNIPNFELLKLGPRRLDEANAHFVLHTSNGNAELLLASLAPILSS